VPLSTLQERTVDFLDVDTAILYRLESVRVLHQSPRGLLGVGEGLSVPYFTRCEATGAWRNLREMHAKQDRLSREALAHPAWLDISMLSFALPRLSATSLCQLRG
jgi:hypothetical protein